MKTAISLLVSTLLFISCNAQPTMEEEKVKAVIQAFQQAGADRNIPKLENILHEEYQVALNRLFGSESVSFWDRDMYLDMIRSEKIGGLSRKVEFDYLSVTENNAVVQTRFIGPEDTLYSYFLLARSADNTWRLIYDMPYVKMN